MNTIQKEGWNGTTWKTNFVFPSKAPEFTPGF
jgi:hypothetical protein